MSHAKFIKEANSDDGITPSYTNNIVIFKVSQTESGTLTDVCVTQPVTKFNIVPGSTLSGHI